MLNAGKSIVRNIFDQNRIGFSARYNFNKRVGIEIGYINWFQQRPSGIDFLIDKYCGFQYIIILLVEKKKVQPNKNINMEK